MAVIDENRSGRHSRPERKIVDLALDLLLDFRPDFPLPLDFHDVCRAGGLYQQVDLASGLFSSLSGPGVAIRRGGLDDRIAQMEVGKKRHRVVDDQVLELESHHGIPLGEVLDGLVAVCPQRDFPLVRGEIFQVEARIVVLEAVFRNSGGPAGFGVQSGVVGNEAAFPEGTEDFRQMSVSRRPHFPGDFGTGKGTGTQRREDRLLDLVLAAEQRIEYRVKVKEQLPGLEKAHAPDVLACVQSRIHLLKIPRDAAGHGKHVDDLARGNAPGRGSPELDALVQGQFGKHVVPGEPSGKSGAVEQIFLDPGGDASANHENQLVMPVEIALPRLSEDAGEQRVVSAHPRNFVEDDDRPLRIVDRLIEPVERIEPVVHSPRGGIGFPRQRGGEAVELVPVRHVLFGSEALDLDAGVRSPARKFPKERRFADSAPAAASDKRRRPFAPKRLQVIEIFAPSNEFLHIFSFRLRQYAYHTPSATSTAWARNWKFPNSRPCSDGRCR